MQKPCLFGMNGFMVFLLTCFTVSARAQQSAGLILIDAENKQAFTVRMGDQMYSSSVHGHLVLSQLKDSAYRLCLRFPKNNLPEQVFPVKVRQKDLGFMLKGDDSSWVLYNWQTKETIHPVYVMDSSRILEMGVKRVDGFSKLMASVVNDSSVMYNTYTGNGFNPNDSLVIGHRVFVIGERPSAARHQPAIAGNPTPSIHPQPPVANNLQPAASSQKPTTDGQLPAPSESGANLKTQPSAFAATGTVKKADKDSLIVARKHQLHIEDSLQTLRKSLIKDSLRAVRAAKASSDSLLAVRKAFLRDSLRQAKKFTKDSLLAAKAGKDSLIAFNRRTQTADKDKRPALSDDYPSAAIPSSPGAGGESRLLPAAHDQLTTANSKTSPVNESPSTGNPRPLSKTAVPKKIREVSLKISRKIVFLDFGTDGRADTVTLFVYFENKDSGFALATKKAVIRDSASVNKAASGKVPLNDKTQETLAPEKGAVKNKPDSTGIGKLASKNKAVKTDQTPCPDLATDADVLFLRSAILKANTDQEKISVASGGFALKCFTVSQVRLLASLFISDKARFRLMDAAHTHIADREHFAELADMYTDKNFQRKFLVMAEKRS